MFFSQLMNLLHNKFISIIKIRWQPFFLKGIYLLCAVPSGEKEKSMDPYLKDPYGCTGALAAKRLERDPFRIGMTYPKGYYSTFVPHLPVPKHPPNKSLPFFVHVSRTAGAGLQGAYPTKNIAFSPHRPLRILTKHYIYNLYIYIYTHTHTHTHTHHFFFHSGVPS